MTEHVFPNDDKEKMVIKIGDKSCEIRPYLSISDLELVSDRFQKTKDIDHRFLLSEIIANHTHDVFSATEINNLDDDVFNRFIEICLSRDDRLKDNYDVLVSLSGYERFIVAVHTTSEQYASELAEAFKSSLSPALDQMRESARIASQSITKALEPAIKMSETLKGINQAWQKTWQASWVNNLQSITESFYSRIPDYSNIFSGLTTALQELVNNIHIPTISEEQKQRLVQSYTAWGNMGWTIPPNAELNVFSTAPKDGKDAYQRIKKYVSKRDMDQLFDDTRQLKHIKKSDYDEAVVCFKSGNYKACSLILFSLIDARLIRAQLDGERNKSGMRASGKQAANNLFGRIESKYITESMLFTMLDQVNILAALDTVFEGGKDFKKQPKVINRNFVDHGMLHRKVTRKDCVLLFLLLYNFTEHLNSFIEIKVMK